MPLARAHLPQEARFPLNEGEDTPPLVWPHEGESVLVDGHHRYRIAKELGRAFTVVEKSFRNLEEVLDWIDRNQLARRNLTDAQFLVVVGRIYEREKKAVGRPQKCGQNDHKFEGQQATARRIATEFGIGEKTVRRAARFAQAVAVLQETTPELAQRVLADAIPDALTELPKLATDPETLIAVARKLETGEAARVKEAVRLLKTEHRHRRLKAHVQDAASVEHPNFHLLSQRGCSRLGGAAREAVSSVPVRGGSREAFVYN